MDKHQTSNIKRYQFKFDSYFYLAFECLQRLFISKIECHFVILLNVVLPFCCLFASSFCRFTFDHFVVLCFVVLSLEIECSFRFCRFVVLSLEIEYRFVVFSFYHLKLNTVLSFFSCRRFSVTFFPP